MNGVIYLINLDGSDERLSQATAQLSAAGLTFERVSAFDGRGLDPLTVAEYDSTKALAYMGRMLKGGELGIYYSHLQCARQFLQTNADYAVVFEDDMQIVTNASVLIEQILAYLETQQIDWYLLNIGAEKQKIFSPLQTFSNHTLVHAHYFPMTATGLVWSRKGAQAFVANHHKIFAPVDNYFRFWLTRNNKGFAVLPSIVVASGVDSEVDAVVKRKMTGRSRWYGLAKQRRLWVDKTIAIYHKWFNL